MIGTDYKDPDTCEKCYFVRKHSEDNYHCHRRSPGPSMAMHMEDECTEALAHWPLVAHEVDWCGEFRAKAPDEVAIQQWEAPASINLSALCALPD